MRRATNIFAEALVLLQTPLGFIFVIGISVAFLLVESTDQVFSQQGNEKTSEQTIIPRVPEESNLNGLSFDTEPLELTFGMLPTSTPTPTQTPSPTPTPSPGPTATPDPIAITFPEPTITQIPTPVVTDIVESTPIPQVIDANSEDVWNSLAQCESGGNWNINTGNGYYGGLQFSQSAWESVGGSGNPADASREEQIERGKQLQTRRGWGAWGSCASRLGLK